MRALIRQTNVSIIIALWMIGTVQFRHQTCKKRRGKKLCSAITGYVAFKKCQNTAAAAAKHNMQSAAFKCTFKVRGKGHCGLLLSLLAVLP